ncbi:Cytochrome c1, heme protein, mitochondrial [Hondaea fermentalgiana]|uniref:Cytochrome c1, heme protein, mitochondrial n=1 Tax=Hondaea fermentalgiana TaxID=2315210 RepID=A0A2R5GI94_9STRA|nr:Cytochrome c1, heme protein, mitochondrial [Hondaea fermentalgiana]|eukprot:GBG29448.1 Cytochrome c1, heme protein, mitochondrial [Hondaea fermentalgiana]
MFHVGSNVVRRSAATAVPVTQRAAGTYTGAKTWGASAARALAVLAAGTTAVGTVVLTDDEVLHPPKHDWHFNGPLSAFDHKAIRRGHQVYTQVCAACHSMELVAFRTLIDVAFTEDEVKTMTAELDVEDGPDDTGEMFERPGKPSDYFPSPYKNEEEGRMANAGAYPPDLSLIVKARHAGADYIFSLLTGYRDAPEGVTLRDGLYYNPYFPGGAIGMPKQLEDGGVEYEDGTPATETQMAHDVTTFLAWAAEPEMEDRKRQGFKWITALVMMAAVTGFYKRFRFAILKGRKIEYTN